MYACNLSIVPMTSLTVSLTQKWNAYNLRWKPEDFNNVTTINVPRHMVWVPDILMYNRYVWVSWPTWLNVLGSLRSIGPPQHASIFFCPWLLHSSYLCCLAYFVSSFPRSVLDNLSFFSLVGSSLSPVVWCIQDLFSNFGFQLYNKTILY